MSNVDKSITIEVPEERVAEFYAFFGRFLAGGEGRRRGHRGPGPRGRHGGHRCGPPEGFRRAEREEASTAPEPAATAPAEGPAA